MTVTTGSADVPPIAVGVPGPVVEPVVESVVEPTAGPVVAVQTTTATTQPPSAEAPFAVTAPPAPSPGLLGRARTDGVTGPATVALSAALVAVGALLDLRRDATLGLGTGVAVAIVAVAAPLVVRFRSLPTAAVLPPLLVAASAAGIARLGGQNRGMREVVLDVGTTLALAAPMLFGLTALGLVAVLVRVARHVATR